MPKRQDRAQLLWRPRRTRTPRRTARPLLAALALVLGLLAGAFGTPIQVSADSSIVIGGNTDYSPYGKTAPTFGQTITVPTTDPVLHSFAFDLNVPAGTTMRGEVYAWDGEKITGPLLYRSPPTTSNNPGGPGSVGFDLGDGVQLTPGGIYVLLITTTLDGLAPADGSVSGNIADVYADGEFVYSGAATHGELATAAWKVQVPAADLKLVAKFRPLPATSVAVSGAATAGEANVTLRAAITRQADDAPAPIGGGVTFTYNGVAYNATTDAQGVATTTAPLPAGTAAGTYPAALTAHYYGAAGFAARTVQGPLTVAPAPPPPGSAATAVGVTGTATAGGSTVTLRASVARQSDGGPVPAGGAVSFTYNGQTYGATTDAQGVATASAALPANAQPGSYPGAVRASYAGAVGYVASQGEGPLNVGTASCSAHFADVENDDPACPAILTLTDRGVIYGYATNPPTFGPLVQVQRAETAAFLVRALGWGGRAQGPRTFSDLAPLEGTDLAKAVRIVANACDAQGCVAQGPGDGTFQPTKMVTRAEVIAFLARAFRMDPKYAWAQQPGAPQPYAGVPAALDTDVRTYVSYAGAIPDAPTTAEGWNAPASRAWVARVLYQALSTKP